jgi:hypothetical protein
MQIRRCNRASVKECEEMFLSKAACLGHLDRGSNGAVGFCKNGKKLMTNFKLLSAGVIASAMRTAPVTMRKTILSLLGSTLIVASMANAAMAAEHITRHHKTHVSERVRNAFGSYNPNVVSPEYPNAFGTVDPWKSGIRPDDWRQSVNGD